MSYIKEIEKIKLQLYSPDNKAQKLGYEMDKTFFGGMIVENLMLKYKELDFGVLDDFLEALGTSHIDIDKGERLPSDIYLPNVKNLQFYEGFWGRPVFMPIAEKLEKLEIRFTNLQELDITHCPKIKKLRLISNRIDKLEHLNTLTNLSTLVLVGELNLKSLDVSELKNLEVLNLAGCSSLGGTLDLRNCLNLRFISKLDTKLDYKDILLDKNAKVEIAG